MGKPTVHPTGVTIYNPEKCFNGYTVFPAPETGVVSVSYTHLTLPTNSRV